MMVRKHTKQKRHRADARSKIGKKFLWRELTNITVLVFESIAEGATKYKHSLSPNAVLLPSSRPQHIYPQVI